MKAFCYISKEIAENTKYKSIYNAYNKNELSVIVYDGIVWAIEGYINNNVYRVLRKEMKRLFPQLKYLYEIERI